MNIVFSDYEVSFEFCKGQLNSLVVEDKDLFERMILDIYSTITGENEKIFLSENATKINMHKKAGIISSPLDFIYNKRELQKKLLSEILEEMKISGYDEEICELYGRIISRMDEISIASSYDFEFEDNIGISDIIKGFNVTIKNPSGTFSEKAIDYFTTLHRLQDKDIFILANCDAYLKEGDYIALEKWMQYENVWLIFLTQHQVPLKISQNEYIIDDDICIIH